jgi:hypothetical protein
MDRTDEDKIQYQQENTHRQKEQPEKGDMLPALLEHSEEVKGTPAAGGNKNEKYRGIKSIHGSMEFFLFSFV